MNPDFYWEWMNPETTEENIKELLSVGFTREDFKAHPVSNVIYKDRSIDDSSVLEPVPALYMFLDID